MTPKLDLIYDPCLQAISKDGYLLCQTYSDMRPVIEVFFEKPPYLPVVVICVKLNVTYCVRSLYSDLLLFCDFCMDL